MLPVCRADLRGSLLESPGEVTMFRKVLKVDNTDGVRRSRLSHHVHNRPALTLRTEFEDFIVERTTVVITTLKNVNPETLFQTLVLLPKSRTLLSMLTAFGT